MTNNRIKISEIAKEAAISSKDIIKKATELGIEASKPYDLVSEKDAGKIFDAITKKPVATGYPKSNSSNSYVKPKQNRGYVKSQSSGSYIKSKSSEAISPAIKTGSTSVKEVAEVKTETARTRETPRRREIKRIVPKQKGLKIIKKRRPAQNPDRIGSKHSSIPESVFSGAYGKLSEEARKELNSRKGKKGSNSTARKKNNGEELNIFNQNFKDEEKYNSNRAEPEEVFLLDYRDQSLFADTEEKKEETATAQKKEK